MFMNKKNIYLTIGKRIREEREKSGLTQEELADKANLHPAFLPAAPLYSAGAENIRADHF